MKTLCIGRMALGAMLAAVPPASGQDAALDGVEQLVSEARYDSARQMLELWWNEGRMDAGRSDRERGLWLRGLLTVDPGMAERDFLRVVVEHRGGTYSDDALLRLAHIGEAALDYEGAIRHLETLLRDHPDSFLAPDARAMIQRIEALPPPGPVASVPDPSTGDPTTGSQGGVSPVAAPQPSGAAPPATDVQGAGVPEPVAEPLPTGPLVYSVQLGVFSTESRAYTLAATADGLGVTVRLARLPGSEMVHVRSGYFDTRSEAEAFAREVQLTGLSGVVFDDGGLEQSVLPGVPD